MHSTIFAARDHKANTDLVANAKILGDRFGLEPALVDALVVNQRATPEVKALYQREAVATLLGALIEATTPKAKGKAKAKPAEAEAPTEAPEAPAEAPTEVE